MIREIKIKYAVELFQDYPTDWTDEMIDQDMRKWMKRIFAQSVVWCHNDEELFKNPYKCKKFVNIPIKKGCVRIRYAKEETIYVDYRLFKEDPYSATKLIRHLAEYQNARSFIWCRDGQSLFKEN